MKRVKIAIVIASMVVEYAKHTLQGIISEAKAQNVDIYIFNAQASADDTLKHNIGEYNIYNLADYSVFDGVILFANLIQGYSVLNNVIDKIKASGVMTVSIDTPIEGFCNVGIENYNAMRTIVEHFVEHHGFTRINYISGMRFNTDSQQRLQAYCDVLREHHIPVDEKRIYSGSFTQLHGEDAALKMLEQWRAGEELPQAVICATDSLAIGARSIFVKNGIRIPQDVALSGFDNMFEARNAIPRMTTVDRDQRNVGRQAVRRIMDKLAGREVPMYQLFPAVPVIAGSCGCEDRGWVDIPTIRKKLLELESHYERYLFQCNAMMEDLNETKTLAEVVEHIKYYVRMMDCESFYLCLDKQLREDLRYAGSDNLYGEFHDNYLIDEFPKIMSVVLAYEKGRDVVYDDFSSGKMWCWQEDKKDNGRVYLFSPIHFRDRCMGYAIVENSNFAVESPLFNTWMINLSNGLEGLRKQAQLKNMLGQMDRMYVADPLTGLYNRFGFARYTGDDFKQCTGGGTLMILFTDLDGLKKINDQYGHDKGDIAIKAVADALRQSCMGGEVCARFGGDEFVVYASGYQRADAEAFCDRFAENIKNINEKLQQPFLIQASLGYEIVHPQPEDVLDKYIDMADNQMYINKKHKKSELSHKSE